MKKKNFDKPSSNRDQYTVVLEDLRSQFKVFGEALTGVDDKVTRIDGRVGTLETDMKTVKDTVTLLSHDVKTLTNDMQTVKGELSTIRHNQVTRDEFKLLETRVLRLEKSRK